MPTSGAGAPAAGPAPAASGGTAPAAAPSKGGESAPAAPAAGKGGGDHQARARNLAGQFLRGELGKEPEAPAAGAEPAKGDAPAKPAPKTDPKKPSKAEAAAAAEAAKVEADKKAAEEAAAKEREEEAKLDKGFKELRRQKKQLRESQAERAAFEQERAQHRAEKEADERLKREDPAAWLEKHQFDFREVAKASVAKESETPEQRAQRERDAKIDAENERLRKELDEIKNERAAEKQRVARANLRDEVLAEWPGAKASYPTLSEHYTPAEIEEAANTLRLDHYRTTRAADAKRRGVPEHEGRGVEAPLSDVFAHMERNARKDRDRFSRREATPSDRTERETVDAEASKTRAKVGPPVTNQVSATRASPQTNLTEAEKRERSVGLAKKFFDDRDV